MTATRRGTRRKGLKRGPRGDDPSLRWGGRGGGSRGEGKRTRARGPRPPPACAEPSRGRRDRQGAPASPSSSSSVHTPAPRDRRLITALPLRAYGRAPFPRAGAAGPPEVTAARRGGASATRAGRASWWWKRQAHPPPAHRRGRGGPRALSTHQPPRLPPPTGGACGAYTPDQQRWGGEVRGLATPCMAGRCPPGSGAGAAEPRRRDARRPRAQWRRPPRARWRLRPPPLTGHGPTPAVTRAPVAECAQRQVLGGNLQTSFVHARTHSGRRSFLKNSTPVATSIAGREAECRSCCCQTVWQSQKLKKGGHAGSAVEQMVGGGGCGE